MTRSGSTQPVFRFAPSPNGRLHLGHAYSALLNEKLAREAGGRLLLRIEDIDTVRCTEAFTKAMIEDLDWLGISFERSPRLQSQHTADYHAALAKLQDMGLLYRCSCSRSELAKDLGRPLDPMDQPVYSQQCRLHGAKAGLPFALRLKMDEALARHADPLFMIEDESEIIVDPMEWGDVILGRKDIGVSYHIAVVVDDALQGVSHVVRGVDMLPATSIHILLQYLLGLPHPHYHHHPLIMQEEGRKLSKSEQDPSLDDLRQDGVTALQIRKRLGFG